MNQNYEIRNGEKVYFTSNSKNKKRKVNIQRPKEENEEITPPTNNQIPIEKSNIPIIEDLINLRTNQEKTHQAQAQTSPSKIKKSSIPSDNEIEDQAKRLEHQLKLERIKKKKEAKEEKERRKLKSKESTPFNITNVLKMID